MKVMFVAYPVLLLVTALISVTVILEPVVGKIVIPVVDRI